MDDPRSPTFRAFIDYHGPDHSSAGRCAHAVAWKVKKHWRMQEWLDFANRYHGQVKFAKFIEDHALDVHVPKDAESPVTPGQLIEVAQTFKAKRNVAFTSEVDTHNGDTELGYKAKTAASAGADGKLTIPREFVIAVPVMEGSTARVPITVRFGYRIDQDEKTLSLCVDMLRINDVLERASEEIIKGVREALHEEIPIYNGTK